MKQFQPISKCSLIMCFAVVLSPLTVAQSTVQDSTAMPSSRQEVESMSNRFEGNVTLQSMVKEKYGITISEVLNMQQSRYNNVSAIDWSGPHYVKRSPEWEANLIVHLIKDEIKKANKTLRMIPSTYVDDGKWYIEFTCEAYLKNGDKLICPDVTREGRSLVQYQHREDNAENITVTVLWPLFPVINGSQVYCYAEITENETTEYIYSDTIPIVFHTVVEKVSNDWGPWIWPWSNATVYKYNATSLVNVTVWVYLHRDWKAFCYHLPGLSGSELHETKLLGNMSQRDEWGYKKFGLSIMLTPSLNGTVLYCNSSSYKGTPITLLFLEEFDLRVEPNRTVFYYNNQTHLEINCSSWFNDLVVQNVTVFTTWYQVLPLGKGQKRLKMMPLKKNDHLTLKLSKFWDPSESGTEIFCAQEHVRPSGRIYTIHKTERITLIHLETECSPWLAWMSAAVAMLVVFLTEAATVAVTVIICLRPRTSKNWNPAN